MQCHQNLWNLNLYELSRQPVKWKIQIPNHVRVFYQNIWNLNLYELSCQPVNENILRFSTKIFKTTTFMNFAGDLLMKAS